MKEYQAFPISNFRTGFAELVEPWLLPKDAYSQVINAHLYRGVLQKITGYQLFANMTYRKEITLSPAPDGATKTFTGTLNPLPVTTNFYAWGAVVVGSTVETFSYFSDASPTVINLVGSLGGFGTVNISNGAVSITFNTAPPAGTYSTVIFAWDFAPASASAIMGIKQYYDIDGNQSVMVFDQLRVGLITQMFGTVLPMAAGADQAVSEIPHDYYQSVIFTGDGTTVTFSGTLTGAPFYPGTLQIRQYAAGTFVEVVAATEPTRIVDSGFGGIIGPNVDPTMSFVNYSTGAYTIVFTVAPATGNKFDATTGVYGNLFTGSISNFFTLDNYEGNAFFTNSVDPIFYYDGTTVKYLLVQLIAAFVTSTGGMPTNLDITKCLHLVIYRDRLVLMSPTVDGTPEVSSVYWSVPTDPFDFKEEAFNLRASTSEPIKAFSVVNYNLLIRFSNSERMLTYTSDTFEPFRFDSTNNLWACDAPYSPINYDSWFSSVGRPAIVGSNGRGVTRADETIPDFTMPTRLAQQVPVPYMSQTSIRQCYGQRFDDLKEGWLCYNSAPQGEGAATASDNVLAFNYIDETYAVYTFPFSCLGLGKISTAPTWGTYFETWGDAELTWGSYSLQNNALLDLAGDQFDKVYELNVGSTLGDDVTPVLMSVITKNFNPFIEEGQLARLGYVDLFVSADPLTTLRVQFYISDQLAADSSGNPIGYYQETVLTFGSMDAMSPRTNQTKVWKRIYVGAVGKEHTIRFYQNAADFSVNNLSQPVNIHAMVLYMKPAGRIFQ